MSGYPKIFICKHCGNMVDFVNKKGGSIVCCNEEMTEIMPNTVDASVEKHKPVITVFDNNIISVEIGSIPHPMQDDHHIAFVFLETEHGCQRKCLKPGEEPKITFSLSNDKPIAAYAYCNLHGLWKTEIQR